jgi:hypothetical protein
MESPALQAPIRKPKRRIIAAAKSNPTVRISKKTFF